ncbi:thioredoxin family protein [bacterium]|nr:thioredoxin family protein [bacterium]
MSPRSVSTTLMVMVCLTSSAWGADGPIPWRTDFDHALGEAKATGKLILVNIHATWCIPCKKLNATTLMDPGLATEITQSTIPVSLDADQDANVIRQWPITGFPTQLFLTPDGQILNTIVGFVPVETYLATLRKSQETYAANNRSKPSHSFAAVRNQDSMSTASPNSTRSTAPSSFASKPAMPNAMSAVQMPAPTKNSLSGSASSAVANGLPPVPMLASKQTSSSPGSSGITSVFSPPPGTMNSSNVMAQASNPSPPMNPSMTNSAGPPARFVKQEVRSSVMPTLGTGEVRPCDASVPLGLDGYCPVSMFKRSELVRGADDQCCVFKDKRYQFMSVAEREMFIQNPKKFLPSEDGLCVVTWAEDHRRASGSIDFPALFGDYLFLFSSDDARQRFLQDPEKYVDGTGRAHRIPLHTFRGERAIVR